MTTPVTLAVLPGTTEKERLVLEMSGQGLELRHESFADGLGWFTQSRVPVDSSQVAQLRTALGSSTLSPSMKRYHANWSPRVVRADSA